MNKKAILAAGATVSAVAGALFLAKKKGWGPLGKNWHKNQEATQPATARKSKAA